jgi:transposase
VPRKKLPVRRVSEILRLRAEGVSVRDIAASTGASKTTVYEYLARAEAAGVGWPLPDDMEDAAVE